MGDDLAAERERFIGSLAVSDRRSAVAQVRGLLDSGTDPVDVLVDVIAAGQFRVGERWQHAEWTVVDEHAATAVSIAATEAVGTFLRRTRARHGRVLVACAEREWHALPATIVGYALRAGGWNVRLLGAATAPARLARQLDETGPDVLAVSCSVLGSLPTTRRFVEAATGAGIPVLAGGPAFGPDRVRADALGATAWAPDARSAVDLVGTLPAVVPAVAALPPERADEVAALELQHRDLADGLRERWSLVADVWTTRQRPLDGIHAAARDVVDQALHAVAASLLTGDPRILPDTGRWIASVLAARGAEPALVGELRGLLLFALQDHPLASAAVAQQWPDDGGPSAATG